MSATLNVYKEIKSSHSVSREQHWQQVTLKSSVALNMELLQRSDNDLGSEAVMETHNSTERHFKQFRASNFVVTDWKILLPVSSFPTSVSWFDEFSIQFIVLKWKVVLIFSTKA